jgi:tetratricopeptide (TPR) repeat protein
MAGVTLRLQSMARHLPLLLVCLGAAFPAVLWLVYVSDPELAVRIAQGTRAALWTGAWTLLGVLGMALLLYPPAPAWLRRAGSRTWIALTIDQAPLYKAVSELRHFETGTRHAEIGRLLRLRRQNEAALRHLSRAVELDPTVVSAWHQFGLVAFAQHEWKVAATAFDRAESLEPGHAFGDAQLYLGRCLYEIGDARALDVLRAHQQRHGGGPRSHLWLADALQRAGDTAGAVAALHEAAAPPRTRLTAEENWFRALARVRLWGKRGRQS